MCAIAHGCATVQKSDYAKLAGVPVAVLGLLGYVGILAALIRDDEHSRDRGGVPVASSASASARWLTYVEVASSTRSASGASARRSA